MSQRLLSRSLAASILAAALAGCGGGSDSAAAPPAAVDPLEVPAAASQSNAALVAWLGTQPAQDSEMREPVSIDGFMPTLREDDEPLNPGG